MKKIIICFLLLNVTALYPADHKPHAQRRIECFNDLMQEMRNRRTLKEQQHVAFDLPQRNHPIHDQENPRDPKKSHNEKKVDK